MFTVEMPTGTHPFPPFINHLHVSLNEQPARSCWVFSSLQARGCRSPSVTPVEVSTLCQMALPAAIRYNHVLHIQQNGTTHIFHHSYSQAPHACLPRASKHSGWIFRQKRARWEKLLRENRPCMVPCMLETRGQGPGSVVLNLMWAGSSHSRERLWP